MAKGDGPYTKGVRKIFNGNQFLAGDELEKCARKARRANYELMSFNGDIYYIGRRGSGTLIKLPLEIYDFEV